ncbi:MAG: glycoside hydrolase family 9 protein, partial [Planctomycetota bacterium]
NDASGAESLIGAAADSWFAGKTFEEITSASDLIFDNIYGGNGIFSSFETPGSISLKSEWAQDLGLGGMMFWDVSNDASGAESLIGAAADSWFAGKTFTEITSASDLVFDNIYGGNGIFDPVVESDTTPGTPQTLAGDDATVDLTATATILNDDGTTNPPAPPSDPPTVSITDSSVTEGDSGNTALTFTVAISEASEDTITVSYTTADGTASAPADYIAQSGTLTFLPGETSQSIVVSILGDTEVEINETLSVNLANAVGATILEPTAEGTILNDDESAIVDFVQILDDGEAGFTQTGFQYLANPGRPGYETDWHRILANGSEGEARWTFTDLADGTYRISATWQANGKLIRALDAPYTIRDATDSVLTTVSVNQQMTPSDRSDAGADWHDLATVTLSGGTLVVQLNESPTGSGQVLADAIRIEFIAAADPVDPPVDNPPVEDPPVEDPPASDPVYDGTNYAEALQKSFLFYEANRSGDLDEASKRIDWRGDSTLTDGADGIYFGDRTPENLQQGLSFDLTGGYFDAGDHGKFGLPLASTLTTLAWGGIAHADGYAASGQTDELLATIRWGTDYLLKAHVTDANGDTAFFVVQVGDVSADHALWSAPEEQTIPRPAMAITPDKPGSDVAAQSAAAMASASMLFRAAGDVAYADTLLENAVTLYEFADTYRGKYSDSVTEVQAYYNSWSGYYDDLVTGAAWLARATDDAGGDGTAYREKALATYRSNVGGLNNGWTHNWDDASYAAAVLLAQDTGDAAIRQDVEGWLNNWVGGGGGVTITEGGLRYISQWGSLRYAANTALLAGIYADNVNDPNGAYSQLAQDTVDYILGDNPVGISYIVGFGESYPQQPHHRAASGVDWDGFRNGLPNEHILYGALVGGPKEANDYSYNDARDDYISNEVAIDYNAGITGALARSAQRLGGTPLSSGELDALPGISDPTGGQAPPPAATPPPEEPVIPPADPADPVDPPADNEPSDPVVDDPTDGDDQMTPPPSSGDYIDIASWGTFYDSNDHSQHDELLGGRTPITTEALEAYNNLRAFLGLSALTVEDVGQWAFANELTNNTEAWGNDVKGVGLWYAMQGAKVGWIADETFDPQILADIQRTARTVADPVEMKAAVMEMVRQFGIEGYADYLEQYDIVDTFINTLKM